ncbi:PepSY domain-containing protein [Zafaria sp. Z1313]|uniref:PepSY domain-containing protein n=1 Tax=Zafaria sp. Z1313 TaxID=3423202 RepID=UPI003D303CB3
MHTHEHPARAAVVLAAAALALASCSPGTDAGETSPAATEAATDTGSPPATEAATQTATDTATAEPTDASEAPDAGDGAAALTAAIGAALAAVPGDLIELDQGTERGTPVWEAVVLTGAGAATEVYLDRATLDVLKQESTEVPELARGGAPAIAAADAVATVAAARTSAELSKVELDDERGRIVWEVYAAAPGAAVEELHVDAATGELLSR